MLFETVTAPVAPEIEMPEPATMEVTPELVILIAPEAIAKKEVQDTPLAQETVEVATESSKAGLVAEPTFVQ